MGLLSIFEFVGLKKQHHGLVLSTKGLKQKSLMILDERASLLGSLYHPQAFVLDGVGLREGILGLEL